MADEKKAVQAEKPAKKEESRLTKIIAWCKALPRRIAKPFKNMYYELKKVTWPSKQKLIAYSIIVLVFMLFMGIVIGLLDMGASALIKLMIA
jgi:preprotein translocase subunit SecE